jgi:hypothetical protein
LKFDTGFAVAATKLTRELLVSGRENLADRGECDEEIGQRRSLEPSPEGTR